ncbi:unnamed protein product [Linum tenue]|uniref:TIR domain-containing protein n=1 Tax=Linum tenue TaxID=586396 RepID=A0AAV0JWP4_9ROSI|nr:unnamed protein product [Linum tenue]
MDYMKWAVTVIGLLLPLLIILYKLWLGRRISNRANNVDNASRTLDSIASASGSADSDTLLPLPFGEYEVFMNFRGPDTRYQITDILFRFLVNLKIRTFKDDDELRKGEGIWPNLVEAIEQSKIYVTIFSENYAYSKWCLKELAVIVEHQERNQGCIILPIFYMVDPRDVRHQSGPYLRAFRQHENFFDEETIRIWKAALNKVGALKGWHVKSNDEQGAIADLVTGIVWSHLSKNNFLETDKLIGMDDHIEVVKERLALDSPCMTIVGIHGIGGIGKTTIAKAVYNKVSPQFDRCSFVEDVREMLQQRDGIIILQKHIISDILRVKNFAESIANNSAGIRIIKDRISRFKFLIVLDDVDEKFRFDKILGNIKNFVSGSRFIITSRNVKVLSTLTDDCKLYKVLEMNHSHALQLFCNHSFKQDSPPSSYETLSNDIVSVAAGLPLTLKVVGSLLFQEEKVIWEDKLRQLKEIPEEEVVERLKISYDTLNEEAKQIFLDIACFFIGEDKDLPSYMWSDCDFFPISNINILRQRSMIEIASHDYHKPQLLRMHDQLRDMGREIVRQESIRHPWQRSRIWSKKTTLDMLRNKKETNRVEGIRTSYEGDGEGLEKECFMNLSELRCFDIIATVLSVDFSSYLLNLRWLRLKIGYGGFMPKFCVENLVILELLSPVKDGWKGLKHIKMASKLKVLKLSGEFLIEYPQFPHSRSLEVLYLENFGPQSSHEDLDIGNLLNLKVLLLRYCEVRSITGGTIGMMKGLRELNITDLRFQKNLREALADIGELQFLEILIVELRNENLMLDTKLPPSLKVLVTPFPIANLPELLELEKLTVNECELKIPLADSSNMWWKISKLKHLKLYRTKITIPINTSLPLLPSSLTTLHIDSCSELECFPSLKNLENLTDLSIECCPILKEIHGLGGLKSLRTLSIVQTACNLDGLESLHALTSLKLTGCDALERLPSMASLSKLLDLDISFCDSLTEIQGLGGLKSLRKFRIFCAKNLTHLLGLESMVELVELSLHTMVSIRRLPSLSKLQNLKKLIVTYAPNLLEIEGLAGLKSLEHLSLTDCRSLERLPADQLSGLKQLESVYISGCTKLIDRSSLSTLQTLTTLLIIQCPKLQWLPNLENLENLTYLSIGGCPFLKEILGLVGLKSLETLRICDMKALRNVDGFESLYSLKSLTLRCCDALERLPSMGSLSNLLNLYISNCHGLTEIQDLGGLESLQMLDIHDAKSLSGLFGFETLLSLNKLEILKIGGCPRLTSLQFHDLDDGCQSQAAALDSLQELNVCGTTLMLQSFCRMIQLLMFPSLTELTLGGVKIGNGYTELLLDGLESMEGLVRLHLYDLASIRILPSLSKLGNLERLTVKNAPNLQEIEGLGGLKSLKELHLIRCTSLESVPADELYGLERLESLDIRGCTNLKNRSSLRKLEPTVKIQWPNSGHTVRGV